jgi:hypothetical protein
MGFVIQHRNLSINGNNYGKSNMIEIHTSCLLFDVIKAVVVQPYALAGFTRLIQLNKR